MLTLRSVSRDLPLIWPMHPEVEQRLDAFKLRHTLAGERVACLPFKPHAEFVALLNNATCVLSDSWDVQAEAAALGIPWLALGAGGRPSADRGGTATAAQTPAQVTRAVWDCIFNGRGRVAEHERADGKSAGRIANSMAAWLENNDDSGKHRSTELERSV